MKRNQRGFTLLEIIIVIAILGILAVSTLAAVNPFEQIKKSNDAKRKSDLVQIRNGLEVYYSDHGQYPQSSAAFQIINKVGNVNTTILWGGAWPPYMNVVPSDPKQSQGYVYYAPASANGQTYYLYASLERGTFDAQACNKGSACTSLSGGGFPPSASCGGVCNYGISSPNVTP